MAAKIKIKAFWSDWSGVNSNDLAPIRYINEQVFAYYGVPLPSWDEMFSGGNGNLRTYLAKHGVNLSQKDAMDLFYKYFEEAHEKRIRPQVYPEVPDVVRRLHAAGIPMAIVSSHPERYLVREAQEYGILNCYKEIKAGVENKSTALMELCDQFNIAPHESIYLGDMVSDIEAARRIGMHAAGIAGPNHQGYHKREQLLAANPVEVFDDMVRAGEYMLLAYQRD